MRGARCLLTPHHSNSPLENLYITLAGIKSLARNLLASWQKSYWDSWGSGKSEQPGILQSSYRSSKFSSSGLILAHFFLFSSCVYNGQNIIQSHSSAWCSSSWKMLARCLWPAFRPCVHDEPQTSLLSCPGSHWWTLTRVGSCLYSSCILGKVWICQEFVTIPIHPLVIGVAVLFLYTQGSDSWCISILNLEYMIHFCIQIYCA